MFQRAQYILASQSRRQLIMDVERANGPRNVVVRNFAEDEKEHEVAIEQPIGAPHDFEREVAGHGAEHKLRGDFTARRADQVADADRRI